MMNTYLLFSSYLIFLTQLTLVMIYVGSVRAKNIVLSNVVAIVGTLSFYLYGFAFAFGDDGGIHHSLDLFSLEVINDGDCMNFLLQWALAVATAGITSGLVPMTTRFGSHLVLSFFIAGIVYPVVTHWVLSSNGLLSPSSTQLLFGSGAIDFAGSGLVHLVGGVVGVLGTLIGDPKVIDQNRNSRKSLPKICLIAIMGVLGFLLWFEWLEFNLGWFVTIFEFYQSTTNQGSWILLSRTAKVTMIAASTAGIVTVLGQWFIVGHWNELDACVGCFGGVVAISSGCSVVEPWAAVVCGCFTTFLLLGLNVHYDKSLEAAQLQGVCGTWGLIFAGLFANKELVIQIYNDTHEGGVSRPFGLLMGGGWGLLEAQVVEIFMIVVWVTVMMGPLFYVPHKLKILRISNQDEIISLDEISCQENHVPFYGDYTPLQISISDQKDHLHSYGRYL